MKLGHSYHETLKSCHETLQSCTSQMMDAIIKKMKSGLKWQVEVHGAVA